MICFRPHGAAGTTVLEAAMPGVYSRGSWRCRRRFVELAYKEIGSDKRVGMLCRLVFGWQAVAGLSSWRHVFLLFDC